MKKLLTLALALAISAPVFAQHIGGTNRNAPKIKQSIEAGKAEMMLNYTAITWADGKMMKSLADKDNGARARAYVNESAPKAPLATFKTSIDVTCGKLELAAGEYKIYYTIDDDCAWHINFHKEGADAPMTMKLELMGSEHENKRLLMCLYAEDKGAGVYVAFGSHTGMLTFTPAKKD